MALDLSPDAKDGVVDWLLQTVAVVDNDTVLHLSDAFDPNAITTFPKYPLTLTHALIVSMAAAGVVAILLAGLTAAMPSKGMGSLYMAMFIDSAGAFMVTPFAAVFVVMFGCNGFESSLIGAAFSFTQFMGSIVLGFVSDKFDPKRVLLVMLFFCSLTIFVGGLTIQLPRQCFIAGLTDWHCEAVPDPNSRFHGHHQPGTISVAYWTLVLTRALAGFFASTVATIQLLVAKTSAPDALAGNLGMIGGIYMLGILVGPVIGGCLFNLGMQVLSFCAGTVTMVNVFYTALTLEIADAEEPPQLNQEEQPNQEQLKPVDEPSVFKTVCSSTLVLVAMICAFNGVLDEAMSIGPYGLICLQFYHFTGTGIAGFNFASAIIAAVANMTITDPCTKMFGELKCVAIGQGLRAVVTLILCLGLKAWWGFLTPWTCWLFLCTTGAFIDAPLTSVISRFVPPEMLGATLGFLQSSRSLAGAIAPLIAGALVDFDMTVPLWIGDFLNFVVAFTLLPFMGNTISDELIGI